MNLLDWPVPAEDLRADNKWQRSDHNKRHKVRKVLFCVQAERIRSFFVFVPTTWWYRVSVVTFNRFFFSVRFAILLF